MLQTSSRGAVAGAAFGAADARLKLSLPGPAVLRGLQVGLIGLVADALDDRDA